MTDALHDAAFMDALFDLLIPPDETRNLPGGGSLHVSAEVAAGVLADPLLGPFVQAGAAALREAALTAHPGGLAGMSREEGTDLLRSHLSAHPLLPMGVMRFLCPPYYAHPQVLAGIGEPPRPRFPEGFAVQATDPEVLEKLQTRKTG